MQLPLSQLGSSLGLGPGLRGQADAHGLLAAAHPSGALVALASECLLAVLPVLQASAGNASGAGADAQHVPLHRVKHITALAWFVQLQQTQPRGGVSHHQHHRQRQRQQQQQLHGGGTQPPRSSAWEELVEASLLLAGTAEGALQLYTGAGQLLFEQRLSTQPVQDILVRPHCSGLSSRDASEEVCVCFSSSLVRISTLDLRAQVRVLRLVHASGPAAAGSVSPLPYVRYDLPAAVGPRSSGLTFGPLPPELYTLLSSGVGGFGSRSSAAASIRHNICIVTAGRNPCMAAFEAEEHPSRSTLAALVGMASSLTSGVIGAARTAAGLGPSMMFRGVKSLSSWVIGGLHPDSEPHSMLQQQQPAVSFDDSQAPPKPEPLTLTKQLRDDERVLTGLVPAPLGALLAAPDNLGRVLLLDGADMVAVRMWKGYRDAQCGWLLPAPAHPASVLGALLVLYAPKRQALEVWLPRAGQRLAARRVDYPCRLLPVGMPCGAWGNGAGLAAWQQQCGAATTLVVDLRSGAVWDAMDCLLAHGAA